MAGASNHGRITLFREKAVVRHLRLAHHVRDVAEIEPAAPIRRRDADDQQAIEIEGAHHFANIDVTTLVLRRGKARINEALSHPFQFILAEQHQILRAVSSTPSRRMR
jgi:hypothetical protein